LKKYLLLLGVAASILQIDAQKIYQGVEANNIIQGTTLLRYVEGRTFPDYIRLGSGNPVSCENGITWLAKTTDLSKDHQLVLVDVEKDNLGMDHYKYQHIYRGIQVQNSIYKIHGKNGNIVSFNGSVYGDFIASTTPVIAKENSIELAKQFVAAAVYKWEIPGEEKLLQWRRSDPKATYYPQPVLCLVPKNGNYRNPDFRLSWKMEIYAHEPMSKQVIYVDAINGSIIWTENKIHHADNPGTAVTAYSGSRTIITDSFGAGFRLRESGRGNGIQTYDLNNSTDYSTGIDFVDTDNNWVGLTPAYDQYALDAHFGAEMTYDYYLNVHSRNSIDGSGFALVSYVHYDVGYDNAFWNGTEMTYGDAGGPPNTPLTTLEITGHEISHGLTEFTAGLVYQDESGGLNESFSDIFGVSIRSYAVGSTGDDLWRIAKQCYPPNGFRLMSKPSVFGDPDTYQGTGWVAAGGADNGGVHTNSGVQNYWYFIMCEGDSGVNDNGDAYNVPGIGITDASKIAFRNLTVYLNGTSEFNDAQFYSIISAQDIFGDCSPQVRTTTDAWYAVGIGEPYSDGVTANFTSSVSNICNLPSGVSFTNQTLTGNLLTTYLWDFGDGTQSTLSNPFHNYPGNGTYTVSLMADGAGCGMDTLTQTNFITIAIPDPPVISNYCTNTNPVIADLNATATGDVYWYNTNTATNEFLIGNNYTTPSLSTVTTYYVENHVLNAPQNVPPYVNGFGSGSYFDSPYSEYLSFTVHQPITLNSVKVYCNNPGNKTIELWTSVGAPVTSTVANIPNGESVVNLGWELAPGNYRIGGTHMSLYKNSTGVSFPYSIPSVVTITGSSSGPNRYFYFYDWNVSSSCVSNRIPVFVNMYAPYAQFTWTQLDQVVTFSNTSMNGNNYYWDFGGGNTSTLANPTHDYVWGGEHYAQLVVENSGCFDTVWAYLSIIGIEEENLFKGAIYPVPFTAQMNIDMSLDKDISDLNIEAFDVLGKKVAHIYDGKAAAGDFHHTWNAPVNMSSGTYIIKISYNGKELAKRVIKL
jgi:Zn-dependent metalloprotease